jgi:hypothetical protein
MPRRNQIIAKEPARTSANSYLEVSAAVNFNGNLGTIGQKTRVNGAMHFASLDVEASAEVGEQVQLVLQKSDKDVFGNHIEMPLSASAKADMLDLSLQGVWSHEGIQRPLNFSKPIVTKDARNRSYIQYGLVVVAQLLNRQSNVANCSGQEVSLELVPTGGSSGRSYLGYLDSL